MVSSFCAVALTSKSIDTADLAFPSVIIVYDTLLTMGPEVATVWNGKMNVVNVLYLLNRYAYLLALPVLLFRDLLWAPSTS